jgi:hypothetical protein
MPHLTDTATKTLLAYLRRHHITLNPAFERAALQLALNTFMEWDASTRIQAGHYERAHQRRAYRNGYRLRHWQSAAGEITLHIPKLRQGTYYPDWLPAAETHLMTLLPRLFVASPTLDEVRALTETLPIQSVPDEEIAQFIQAVDALRERQTRAPLANDYTSLWLDVIPVRDERWLRVALARSTTTNAAELLAYEPRRDDDDAAFLAAMQRRLVGQRPMSSSNRPASPHAALAHGFADATLVGIANDNEMLLRYLTQVQTLQHNDITVALGDTLLPTHEANDAIKRILMVA